MRPTLKSCMAILALCLSVQAAGGSAQAAGGRNFGLGFEVGKPTGFSGKYWTSSETALDFHVGWLGYGDGYWDPDCNSNAFYRTHTLYCEDRAYDSRRNYDYGWRILHLHADYLFHNFSAIRSTERFPLFYGPGISLNYLDYDFLQMGVRGNFGIAWMPHRAPIDVFLEIAPVMELFPRPDFDVNAGLGMRFYF